MSVSDIILNIDFSSLILAVILIFYVQRLEITERYPSYLDISLLGAIAVLIPIITMISLRFEGYAVSAIGFSLLITLLFNNLPLSFLFALLSRLERFVPYRVYDEIA